MVAGTDFMLPGESDQLAALVSNSAVREATIDVNALAAKQTVVMRLTPSARPYGAERFRVAGWMPPAGTPLTKKSSHDQHKDQFTQPQRIIQRDSD